MSHSLDRGDFGAVAHTLKVDSFTAAAVTALRAAGVPVVLLKGPSIARRFYADAIRTYVDTDLLVPESKAGDAVSVLARLGFTDTLSGSRLEQAPESVTLRNPNGFEIDLHHTIGGATASGDAVFEAMSRHAMAIAVAGTPVTIASGAALLVQVVLHATHHGVAGGQQREDLRRALASTTVEEWRDAAAVAEEIGATDAFAAGLRLDPSGVCLAEELGLAAFVPTHVVLESWSVPRGVHLLVRLRGYERLRFAARKLVPTPARMRLWSPIAQRGVPGLSLAYVLRVGWLAGQTPAVIRLLVRAARQSRRSRNGDQS